MKPHRIALVCLLSGLLASRAFAVTHTVNNASEFNALPTLNAGDVVVLKSGSYGALNKTLVSSIADDTTAQTDPVIVYAEVAGGVDVIAPSQITLQGRGIILAGLDFVSGSGMLDNGSTSPAWIIRTAADSRYMVLNNVRFLNATAGDDYGHWIYMEGFNHTIEYCSFEGKSTRNATIAFKRNTSEAGITVTRNHRLRYCYFGPRECSTTENGFETIRIGDSSSQAHDMNVTVERNVFYRAIWRADGQKPNDMEIISNKTKGNKFLNNTFLESYGQLTLRHGDACIVDGNFIFGAGYYSGSSILLNAANSYQTGIRIIGQDHIIRNNYLINLASTNLRAALCLMAGDSGFSDGNGSGGSNGYEAAHNAQIYNNTFIDCKEMNLGFVNGGTVQPTGVKIYNNAWQGSGTSNGIVRNSSFTPAGSGGNYIYHPTGSYGWTGLGGTYSSSVSPAITESFDNYKIPTSSSPLLNVANTTLVAANDVRDLTRPTSGRDIGCFEREITGSGRKPLLRNEVGPVFDGGPSGTYVDSLVNSVPDITTTSLPNGTVNVAYSQTLTASGGDAPLTWSLASGTLPAGLSLSSGGVISGTPSASGTSSFTVRVTDADSDTDTQALSLTIDAQSQVAAPTFTPGGGTYSTAQSVTIATTTSGATIRYTTDGTTPTSTTGTVYSSPVSISVTTTLKAIAYKTGMLDSSVTSATYTISGSSPAKFSIPGSAVTASADDGNVPANTVDGSLSTRWSAQGDGQWIQYDLGSINTVSYVKIAWYQGDTRTSTFDVQISDTGSSWTNVLTNVTSSGTTLNLETYEFTDVNARYVRIVGHGNSSGNGWNSITETEVWGIAGSGGGGGGTGAFIMSSNQVSMEAENAQSRSSGGGKSWTNITLSGASGATSNNAIQAQPNSGTTASAPGTGTCRADYQIVVPSGAASTFYVHVRAHGPSGSDDSVFISVNGSTSTYQQFNTTAALGWKTASKTISLPVGTQTLTFWMREDGTVLDKIVVSSSSTLPTGTGPAESPRQ